MPVLVLRETDVQALVTMDDALTVVEWSFKEQAAGNGYNLPRQRLRQPQGTLHIMAAALSERGYWGFKAYTVTRQGARFILNLYDLETGGLLAIIEADILGQMRTGAASGVATRLLARPDADVLALFGSGFQAETQLDAISRVRMLRQVRVYSRKAENRSEFVRRMSEKYPFQITPAESAEEALEGSGIVVTITSSAQPVFPGNALPQGVHINAAGSNAANRTELDTETIRKVDLFYTDDVEGARRECGDLIQARLRNSFNWARLRPLADVVAGLNPGRTADRQNTLFESHGIALWDIALAADVYERARQQGRGEWLNLFD